MVVPIRDIENTIFSSLAIITTDMHMNLLAPVEINIDDFNVSNIDNYNNVRKWTISSNKATSRTASMSSSKTSEDYTTRVEYFNSVPDNKEIREPIDSSQLSYTK